jgi:molybdenum cofactor cytidylyltransferase
MNNGHFAIVLAAGFSRRMGQCKASLKWHQQESFLEYQVSQFLQAKITPLVVLGPHNIHLQKDCLSGCQVIVNLEPEKGKTSSILSALALLPESFLSVTISAVDQPRPACIYEQLLHSHLLQYAPLTAPTHNERLGHPLIFSRDMLTHLMAIREETQGLRAIVTQFWTVINRVTFSDPLVLSDFNTLDLYEACFLN